MPCIHQGGGGTEEVLEGIEIENVDLNKTKDGFGRTEVSVRLDGIVFLRTTIWAWSQASWFSRTSEKSGFSSFLS